MQVHFRKADEVYAKVVADRSALQTLSDEMTIEVPNSRFHPKVRAGLWDGKIRLINSWTGMMYSGLIPHASNLARQAGFDVSVDSAYQETPFTREEAIKFIESLPPLPFTPEDFQIDAFVAAVRAGRILLISPTSSGKSFITYLLTRYFLETHPNRKVLIIIPRQQLALQLKKDFTSYGWGEDMHVIMKGASKYTDARIVVATWQSIYKQPSEYFSQFSALLGDEVHTFAAKCLKEMMEQTTETPIKIGLTGSLDDSKTHELILTGLFGETYVTTTSRELIDMNFISDTTIKVFVFSYSDEELKSIPRETRVSASGKQHLLPPTYQAETKFILSHPKRNKFIKNLAAGLEGNIMILFRRIEDHGDILLELLQTGEKPVYYIHGKVDSEEREAFRQIAESNDGVIGLASDGTFSTGTSINNLQHVFKVNPLKAVVNNKQSIGRGQRRDGRDNHFILYDFADDLTLPGAVNKSHLYKHLLARLKLYAKEGYRVKIYKIRLSGSETK